ncbi:hypothetical protein [Companilactobacillus jidongensis]|uniref:hypothetical protein n=1 Tax=Companilactobacillus jidongensis TaxID=2486006 RepID=UPI000F78B7A4|nr:hypothetical protein [Companilactobacillus jidongensis]
MTLDIRFSKIIEEITEDLELQTGLVLNGAQLRELKIKQHVILNNSEVSPYFDDITEYLANTSPSERVWECYKVLSNNTYIIAVHVETPYIRLDTADLNG